MAFNKYRAKRVTYEGGQSFASKLESSVYTMLKAQENAGEIEILGCQKHVYLTEAEIGYIPDFHCLNKKTGEEYFVEAKGFEGERWLIIRKLWRYYGFGDLHIWKGNHSRPFLLEVITPKVRRVPPRL